MSDGPAYPQHFEYIKDWLQSKEGIWKTKGGFVKILENSEEVRREIDQFSLLGRNLTDRMLSRNSSKHPFAFYTLEDDRRNAFAVVPARCSVVLVTTGLIQRLIDVGSEVPANMALLFQIESGQASRLAKVWGDLPRTDQYFQAFGSLLMNAAFSFLVHHELAHLILGHEAQWKKQMVAGRAASDEESGLFCFGEEQYLSGAAKREAGKNDGNQALELDADTHALVYTRDHLNELRIKLILASLRSQLEPVDALFRSILEQELGMRYVLAAASAIALLSLVRGDREDQPPSLGSSSHPQVSVRILAAIRTHFAMASEPAEDGVAGVSTEALAFVLALIAAVRMEARALEPEKLGESLAEAALSEVTAENMFEGYGLYLDREGMDRLDSHIDALAVDMRSYALGMSGSVRADLRDRRVWYAAENSSPASKDT